MFTSCEPMAWPLGPWPAMTQLTRSTPSTPLLALDRKSVATPALVPRKSTSAQKGPERDEHQDTKKTMKNCNA